MRNIIYVIAIFFLFGCKKEKIEPISKISLVGKLKSTIFENNKLVFFYDDTFGLLQKVIVFNEIDTSVVYSFERNENKIFVYPKSNLYNDYFDISINQDGLIKSFKSWDDVVSRNYYSVSYINKLNSFTDAVDNPFAGNGKYSNFTIENGNYIKYWHKFIPFLGGVGSDTINCEYTEYPYDKYAPYQKLIVSGDPILDYLGFDGNFLFPQNKNLIRSIEYTNNLGVLYMVLDFNYTFNQTNQLINTKIVNSNGSLQEYTMEYY